MTDNITGKVLVITGASSGMGEATARDLAAKGAKLVLGARRKDRLDAIVADIKAAGGEAIAVKTDVTRLEDMQALVKAAVDSFGRIDVLFNNAGLMPLSTIEAQKVDEWNQMIDVNLKGTLYGVSAALPYMAEQKSGQIINVASVYGHITVATGAVYCATKHAVRSLSEGLRQEVKPHNIRVTVISPGAVATELYDHISVDEIKQGLDAFVPDIAVPASTMSDMVAFAISQPANVDVNEILFRPTVQPQ